MTHKTPEIPKFTDALPIIPQLRPHQKGNSFTYYKVRMTECRLSLHSELNPSALLNRYECHSIFSFALSNL
jgi:hypothetical protein